MRLLTALSLIALTAMTTFAPAHAQYNYNHNYNNRWRGTSDAPINASQARLQARINRGISDGRLSPSEASRLRSKLSQISRLEASMKATGRRLSFNERQILISQLNRLNNDVTRELNDFERRRVGYWNHRQWR